VAAALGEFTSSPLNTLAAGLDADEDPPNSRRVNANAVHANGAAAGAPPSAPAPNQSNNRADKPETAPPAAGVAVITGADAAAGAATDAAATAAAAFGVTTTTLSAVTLAAGRAAAAGEGTRGTSETPGVEPLPVTGPVTAGADCGAVTGSGELTAGLREPLRRGAVASAAGATASLPWLPRVSGSETSAEVSGVESPREPCTVEVGPCVGDDDAESGDPDPPRAPECDARVLGVDECSSAEPVDPAEPVVSANATAGITTTAVPMPNATASAPTRPTARSLWVGDKVSKAAI
jgi:hypothetical protein